MVRFLWRFLLISAVGLALGGCSGEGAGRVTGSVTLDDRPLADAEVQFLPQKDRSLGAARGKTDSNGKFEILVGGKTGQKLKPGKYVVLVTKYVDKKGQPLSAEESANQQAGGNVRNLVPERYSEPDTSEQYAEIKPGTNDLPPFKLSSKAMR
jgi:hypothetical protein